MADVQISEVDKKGTTWSGTMKCCVLIDIQTINNS
jgi:hypothetical protein